MMPMDAEEVRERHGKRFRDELKALSSRNGGILAAQVCTSDGFEVASVQRNEESHRRLAAMVSSLHALGSAMVEEAELGCYQNLIIEATDGKCLMMAVPGTDGGLLLAAVAAPALLFGHFHLACKGACEALGEHLAATAAGAAAAAAHA